MWETSRLKMCGTPGHRNISFREAGVTMDGLCAAWLRLKARWWLCTSDLSGKANVTSSVKMTVPIEDTAPPHYILENITQSSTVHSCSQLDGGHHCVAHIHHLCT